MKVLVYLFISFILNPLQVQHLTDEYCICMYPYPIFFLVCYVILQWFFKQTTREHETEDKLTHRASSAVKIWCEQTDLGKAPDRQWSTTALQAGGRQGQAPQWEWSIRQGSHGTLMIYMYNIYHWFHYYL